MTTGFRQFQDAMPGSAANFDIFAAFERLDTNRKLTLCDQLFHGGVVAYRNTVTKLWPMASDMDAMKLQRLLQSRIEKYLK